MKVERGKRRLFHLSTVSCSTLSGATRRAVGRKAWRIAWLAELVAIFGEVRFGDFHMFRHEAVRRLRGARPLSSAGIMRPTGRVPSGFFVAISGLAIQKSTGSRAIAKIFVRMNPVVAITPTAIEPSSYGGAGGRALRARAGEQVKVER